MGIEGEKGLLPEEIAVQNALSPKQIRVRERRGRIASRHPEMAASSPFFAPLPDFSWLNNIIGDQIDGLE